MDIDVRNMNTTGLDRRHLSYDYWRYQGRNWRAYEVMYKRMRPVPPVLELGCGLGFFLECCLQHGTWAVGVEISREGAAACASRSLPVVRSDIGLPLPFRENTFGSALAHHVLEHITPATERRVLRELHRILRPDGFLLVVSPNAHHPRATEDPDHINLFTPRQLKQELQAAGFRRVSLATNYWRPIWDPALKLGRLTNTIAGALWKVAPIDRLAGSASAIAQKR